MAKNNRSASEKSRAATPAPSSATPSSTATMQRQPQPAQPAHHDPILTIGETAGKIWHRLNGKGEVEVSALVADIGTAPELVHRAIGWLARENKLVISRTGSIKLK
jgi:hypothetical protein